MTSNSEKPRTYCPVTNNCEHFATECKTGTPECHQKWTPIAIGVKNLITTIVSRSMEVSAKRIPTLVAGITEIILCCIDFSEMQRIEKLTSTEVIEVVAKRLCAALLSLSGNIIVFGLETIIISCLPWYFSFPLIFGFGIAVDSRWLPGVAWGCTND